MWEKFVEELMSMWTYLSVNKGEREKLLEDKDENDSQLGNHNDQGNGGY